MELINDIEDDIEGNAIYHKKNSRNGINTRFDKDKDREDKQKLFVNKSSMS